MSAIEEISQLRATAGLDVPVVVMEDGPALSQRVAAAFDDGVRIHTVPYGDGGALPEAARRGVTLVAVTPGTPEWDEWLVRSGGLCAEQPVVLVATEPRPRAVVEAFRAGVADVLVEPVDPEQLRSAIERIMTRRPVHLPESSSQRWAAAALAAVKPADPASGPDRLLAQALGELVRLTDAPAGAVCLLGPDGRQVVPHPLPGGCGWAPLSADERELVERAASGEAIRFVSTLATNGHRWALLVVPVRGLGARAAVLALRVGETTRRRLQFERADLAFFAEQLSRAWGAAQLQRLIQHAKQEYESIVDATSDCLLLLDPQLRVQRVNEATARGLGRLFQDILGQPFAALFPGVQPLDAGVTTVDRFLQRAAESPQRSVLEVTGFLKPGDIHEIHAYPGPDASDGRLTVLFVKDVGDMRRLQRQLVQSEKLASLGTLAAGVAHEINNPVGYVTSNLHRLREYMADFGALLACVREGVVGGADGDPETLRAAARAVRADWKRYDIDDLLEDSESIFQECFEGLDHVGVIVRNLKQYAAQGAPREPDLQLRHVAEGALRLVWNKLKYDVRVVQDLQSAPTIMGSSVELMQVLVNLLVNAVDAVESVKDRRSPEVTIATRGEDGGAVVLVQDNGAGIDPKDVDRIFDPFYTTKPPGRGTGLGLAISAEILHRHGARVDVRSAPGEGTTFRVWFPSAAAHRAADAAQGEGRPGVAVPPEWARRSELEH
jgi:signal transduction histidine kinase